MVVEIFTGQSCNFARSAGATGVFIPRSRRFFKKVRFGTRPAYIEEIKPLRLSFIRKTREVCHEQRYR
ncbi:hypothetical protein PCAR4_110059 [Paraburkholderia caribensis]|jgi:hypothetical protein|nr:hypothetical protein PCAR4_110059 [Paraburkholderia caribensis]